MTPENPAPNPGHADGPLAGLKILDMSRILAGPSATQILGDLGADVVKVERPGVGDDTRKWGPPFLKDGTGAETSESSYYLSANRNKRSIAVDFTKPEGQRLVRSLAAKADVLVENYKAGTLARYGLDYGSLRAVTPGLIYCSITGFGLTGPYAHRAGYDYLIQAMGGIMSLTGETEGEPMKVGVAVADLMAGVYATVGILAALHHRDRTGQGQHIDLSLFDTQIAWLSNAGQYYLTSGEPTPRHGNGHPTIVPYQTFRAADDWLILAVGNDGQFARFCEFAGRPDLAADPRFATNTERVRHREVLVPIVAGLIAERPRAHWLDGLEPLGVPCGPINRIDQVFADPQALARAMKVSMPHPLAPEPIDLIGSPLKLSETPVSYRRHPPLNGEHTEEVLGEWLGYGAGEIAALKDAGVC
jgi:crotonobetainyl-CoA:carnitine CoA-transferase CaiB-like acyl-CoA transferase